MAKVRKGTRSMFTDAQRSSAVAQIDQYRASHGGAPVVAVIKLLGLPVTKSNYNAWSARIRAGTLPQASQESVTHFPLEAIPERAVVVKAKHVTRIAKAATAITDDDKILAAQLLEVAAKLLRRNA
jgi:hypothetical protein